MKNMRKTARRASVTAVAMLAGLGLARCATQDKVAAASGSDDMVIDANAKGASQIWAENCMRCHNMRSPASLSDDQWEVAMMHMRVQASLTGEETRKVLELMKAGN